MTLRPGSITTRLTLGLAAIALLVFSLAGVLLHRLLASDLAAADHEGLRGKVQVVMHFIEEARRSGDVRALEHHLDDLLIGHKGLRVWTQSARGDSLYGGVMPSPTAQQQAGSIVAVDVRDGAQLEIVDTRLSDLPPWPRAVVRVAIDTRSRQQLLATHRNTLLVICALGVVLTAGLSRFALVRALASVKQLSAQARAITPDSLGRRLSETSHDNELAGLVQAFNAVLDRLEAAYGQMEAFNANVAHELRTSLATLINGAQVILAGRRSTAELEAGLASTLEDLEQMNALVTDMLFLARADQGDRARGIESVELGAQADQTIHYCDALLREAGISACRIGSAVAPCNPALIRRALGNLLLNAIRYTPRGEQLAIEVERVPHGVRLTVFNPGAEIPASVRARMFDRFFRANTALGRSTDGHGLGLAIVAAIARMHGGRVFAAYSGSGNRIGLELPAPPS